MTQKEQPARISLFDGNHLEEKMIPATLDEEYVNTEMNSDRNRRERKQCPGYEPTTLIGTYGTVSREEANVIASCWNSLAGN